MYNYTKDKFCIIEGSKIRVFTSFLRIIPLFSLLQLIFQIILEKNLIILYNISVGISSDKTKTNIPTLNVKTNRALKLKNNTADDRLYANFLKYRKAKNQSREHFPLFLLFFHIFLSCCFPAS